MKIFKNYKKITIWGHLWPDLPQTVCKSVLKCNRTSQGQKRAARTHIAHMFQNAFHTHIAHVRVCAHVCVCESNFATHSLRPYFQLRTNAFKLMSIHELTECIRVSGFDVDLEF